MPVSSKHFRDVLGVKVEAVFFPEPHDQVGEQPFVGHLSEPMLKTNLFEDQTAEFIEGFRR